MSRRTKFLVAALLAALALSIGGSSAAALRSLHLNGTRGLVLTGRFSALIGGIQIRCNVTVTKTYTPLIPKRDDTVIGHITAYEIAPLETCELLGATALLNVQKIGIGVEERWVISYQAFLGTLPEITGILFQWERIEKEFDIQEASGANLHCLYNNENIPQSLGLLARVRNRVLERLFTLERPAEATEKELQPFSTLGCPLRMRLKYELTPTTNTTVTLV